MYYLFMSPTQKTNSTEVIKVQITNVSIQTE